MWKEWLDASEHLHKQIYSHLIESLCFLSDLHDDQFVAVNKYFTISIHEHESSFSLKLGREGSI
jgi:hypothetical protein